LASLNLPAALEDSTGAEIPQSVKEKAAAVKSNGGLEDLQQMLQELPELLQRNQDILNEVGCCLISYKVDIIFCLFAV